MVEAARPFPASIMLPPYAESGIPPPRAPAIPMPTEEDEAGIRRACSMAKTVLDHAISLVKVGVTTDQIDVEVHNLSIQLGAYPSPLNYMEFPKSVCTSINNVVCHGIPDARPLEDGDIINVDVSVFVDGFHGDTSRTVGVGDIDTDALKLLEVAEESLNAGIEVCAPGVKFSEIGCAIDDVVQREGMSVCREFIGHGIGRDFHSLPEIYHFENDYKGGGILSRMEKGMIFTIEPAVNEGARPMHILEDGWTAITNDDGRSAQFEHTIIITDTGSERLTA